MFFSADATTAALNQLASRDVTGSRLRQYRRRLTRALFVETEAQNVTVAPGDRAVLKCRVQQLGAKTVRLISAAVLLVTFSLSQRIVHDVPMPLSLQSVLFKNKFSN